MSGRVIDELRSTVKPLNGDCHMTVLLPLNQDRARSTDSMRDRDTRVQPLSIDVVSLTLRG